MDKAALLAKFSKEPDSYYRVKLFEDEGFERKKCTKCSRYFWTLDTLRELCPDDDIDDAYSFIGNPPTSMRLDYAAAWRKIESFFVDSGHESINRYPVVSRWREDLYFTIASVVNFQRLTGSGIEFVFPAHSVIVPQTCIRFNDIGNVGITGRHFSSFCMIGQLSVPDDGGYWKDECIDLDYKMLTSTLGIPKKHVTFVEDVWSGGGSFGSSLEYFVGGLELGNAVFTEFQGSLENSQQLDHRVIDMGAGLERFAWLTMGTPTAYDCCFGPIITHMADAAGIESDTDTLCKYFGTIGKNMTHQSIADARAGALLSCPGITKSFETDVIAPLERIYLIADHLRTLAFAITDGALPSNVGGGYNLRVLLRRMMAQFVHLKGRHDIDELIDLHIGYLSSTYPELGESASEIKEIIALEIGRYSEMRTRMESIATKMRASKSAPTVDELVTLYESDGVPPDYLKEIGAINEIPQEFYEKLDLLHQPASKKTMTQGGELAGLPRTEPLFHGDDPHEFDARVLRVGKDFVVLDRTSFYARSGGQEPDHGTIGGLDVTDVTVHAGVIVHTLKGGLLKEGQSVKCAIDSTRRNAITIHHTCTHILNSSARSILGSWVWQHSAFKDETYARLDITHHSALTRDEITKIESLANSIVRKNLPVNITSYSRRDAESKFGFRIYQGGVVPVDTVRIVSVGDFDVEACGGTHTLHTGQIGLVKIMRTERIQDGVIRLVFTAGDSAISFIQSQDHHLERVGAALGADRQKIAESVERTLENSELLRTRTKNLIRRSTEPAATAAASVAKKLGNLLFYAIIDEELDSEYHIAVGSKAILIEPHLVYLALIKEDSKIRIVAYSGADIAEKLSAGDLVRQISIVLGGSGGGNGRFGQGGGTVVSKIHDAVKRAEEIASESK